MDDEAFSPEPRELYTIYECDEQFEGDQQDDEPFEANRPEAQQLSSVHQSLPEFDNDNQDGEPLRQKAQNLDFSSPSDMNSPRISTIEI